MRAVISEGPLRTKRLTVHHLHANVEAERPRVLLLGGSNFDLRLKRSFLNTTLLKHFEVATYEPRGIGRTQQPDGAWSMEDYAEDAASVLDALNWDQAHIVGESFGGMTALHLALKYPNRVARMVIASATAGGSEHGSFDISQFLHMSRETAAKAALCLQDLRNQNLLKNDPSAFSMRLADRVAFEVAFTTPSISSGGYQRLLDARRQHDITQCIAQILTPVAVIAGTYDQQASPEAQRRLCTALPNAEFHRFEAGHGVLFAATEATQCAGDFLNITDG
ncbi:MAG: alpha/beta fold hydrolase [Roseobacter sp.]